MPETVLLGDILTLERDEVRLNPSDSYLTAGILSYGRGLFKRPVVLGSETSYSNYYRLHDGQFVYSKLFAWEGALAVVGSEFDGLFVSQEFPTFSIDRHKAEPKFIRLLCQWPELWRSVREGQTGMGGRRKRVHPAYMLTIPVPLLDLTAQRGVIQLVDDLDVCLERARQAKDAASVLASSLRSSHFATPQEAVVRAGDFFEITMGRQRSPKHAQGDHMVPYLRSANVKDGRLELEDVKTMNFTPTEQSKYALRDGDVLISEGCGSLDQLGAAAQWFGNGDVVCFQNTLLRLRERPGISTPGYANQWARYAFESGGFAAVASGTNIFHIGAERAVEMPVRPTTLEDQESFVATVESADQMTTTARNEVDALVALRSALLEELLSGSREVQDLASAVQESA